MNHKDQPSTFSFIMKKKKDSCVIKQGSHPIFGIFFFENNPTSQLDFSPKIKAVRILFWSTRVSVILKRKETQKEIGCVKGEKKKFEPLRRKKKYFSCWTWNLFNLLRKEVFLREILFNNRQWAQGIWFKQDGLIKSRKDEKQREFVNHQQVRKRVTLEMRQIEKKFKVQANFA